VKVLLIYNASDRRCGIANYGYQTAVALTRAGHELTVWDGTYSAVYARQQVNAPSLGMFPPDVNTYAVVHTCWHAMTLNHYAGAPWADVTALRSWVNGGPSNTTCPFEPFMDVRWGHYRSAERAALGYHMTPLPIADWVTDLPAPDPVFTVGATSIRGDGVPEIRQVCEAHGWAMNLPDPTAWLTLEDEVRRLARSTVNVCWYNTPPLWKDWGGAPSTALASHRPLLISQDSLFEPLWHRADLYHGEIQRGEDQPPTLGGYLEAIHRDWQAGTLRMPAQVLQDLSWTTVAADFTRVWDEARHGR
jgi:hypothetical protein